MHRRLASLERICERVHQFWARESSAREQVIPDVFDSRPHFAGKRLAFIGRQSQKIAFKIDFIHNADYLSKMQSIAQQKTLASCTFTKMLSQCLMTGMEETKKIIGKIKDIKEGDQDMDVSVIRKAHIARLIEAEGGVTPFATKFDTNPDYISSVLSKKTKRNPGAQLMRKIERTYGLRPGSLDQPDEQATISAMALQGLPIDARLELYDIIRYKIESTGALDSNEHMASYHRMISKIITDMKKKKED